MTNIYKKLYDACTKAGTVKKADKKSGMHFNPLLHDDVQEVAVQALLNEGLYPTCSYQTITNTDHVMITCTLTITDVDAPSNQIIIDGCSAMGQLDKFGTGQAMSYARKYAFLNLLNLKTGIVDDDGHKAKSFNNNKKPTTKNADTISVKEIINSIKASKNWSDLNFIKNIKYKSCIDNAIKHHPAVYKMIMDHYEQKEMMFKR
tara:strand:+ start:100 stop:711 length:612 start_codon:yes stop_codon:yes gene_type:complete